MGANKRRVAVAPQAQEELLSAKSDPVPEYITQIVTINTCDPSMPNRLEGILNAQYSKGYEYTGHMLLSVVECVFFFRRAK
jgi:hypothetical protein